MTDELARSIVTDFGRRQPMSIRPSAPAPADGGADVVAANADHVNAMLSLATPRESTDDDSSPDYIETPRSASSANGRLHPHRP